MKIKAANGDTNILNSSATVSDEAWKVMYRNNYEQVRMYVLSNCGNEQQAEDLYHDAFIAAWRNVQLGRFEAKSENSFGNYLLAIAKNKWIDLLRSAQTKKTVYLKGEAEYKEQTSVDRLEEDRNIELIKQQFANLGENCKDLLTAFYYKKKTMREISKAKGWTEPTARNNKYRCLQKLRSLINQKMP